MNHLKHPIRIFLTIAVWTAFLLTLSGCSSFNLGAVCYLPHGMAGTCAIAPASPPSIDLE